MHKLMMNALRTLATISEESVTSENDKVYELNGLTEGEDTAMDSEPEGERDTRSNPKTFQGPVHTSHDGWRTSSSQHHVKSKFILIEKANDRDGLLLHDVICSRRQPDIFRWASGMYCRGRRQSSKHHGQRGP